MTFMNKLYTLLFCLILSQTIQATTIIPYPNLGEMARASDAVILVKAIKDLEITEGEITRFGSEVVVLQTIKGKLMAGETLTIKNHHIRTTEVERMIWGDLEMEVGRNYLLILGKNANDEWQPLILSYGVFVESERDNNKVMVPIELGTEVQLLPTSDGQQAEPLRVYHKEELLEMLAAVVENNRKWDQTAVATSYTIESFQPQQRGTAPSHCTYISSQPSARWDNFPTPLPVYYASGGDAGCSSAFSKIQGAISAMNGAYAGINLTDGGTHNYVPSCNTGATGSEFLSWLNDNHGRRSITIQFNDPCDEIIDLSSRCSGTLAFGGMYFSSSTHTWDDRNWRDALAGYVLVNNGTGACQCSSNDYDAMITHEMTHALGIGHIAPEVGQANMNPSCCNVIQPLDIECLDYTYFQASLPIELVDFYGAQQEENIGLFWTTASEYNNDYFTLEKRGRDGKFEAIGTIRGNNISNEMITYDFLDTKPFSGENYYRLTQTDFDGSITVHKTIVIDFKSSKTVEVFPNPVRDGFLYVNFYTEKENEVDMRIFNINGVLVYQQRIASEPGQTNAQSLQVHTLPEGMYVLQIQRGQQISTHKFIKSRS